MDAEKSVNKAFRWIFVFKIWEKKKSLYLQHMPLFPFKLETQYIIFSNHSASIFSDHKLTIIQCSEMQ